MQFNKRRLSYKDISFKNFPEISQVYTLKEGVVRFLNPWKAWLIHYSKLIDSDRF